MTPAASIAPPLALPDHQGGTFVLRDTRAAAPTVLVFYRGHWCPYCRRYLSKLRSISSQLAESGVRLAAISPEPTATSAALARDLDLPFPLLSDTSGTVIEKLGVRNRLTRGAAGVLAHPAVFVVDSQGVIRFKSVDRNHRKRTTPRRIMLAVRSLLHRASESASARAG